MFFRLIYTIIDFHISFSENSPLFFSYTDTHEVNIEIRHPTREEYSSTDKKVVICIASLQINTRPKILGIFESLKNNQLPEGSSIPDSSDLNSQYIDIKGRVKKNFAIPLGFLPQNFRDFSDGIFNELSESIRRAVLTIRWRYNVPDQPHNPFAELSREWSFDDKKWHPMPVSWHVSVTDYSYVPQSKVDRTEIERLMNAEVNEPLGHELFREAWKQFHVNPRSSLVIGIASAETGFKNLVAELVPNAAWLISEIQSPPLKRMVNEYLPLLPIKNRIGEKGIYYPKKPLEIIEKGIFQRNSIVHGKQITIDRNGLHNLLLTIQDFLWVLDFYRGNNWAIEYIDKSLKEEWDD